MYLSNLFLKKIKIKVNFFFKGHVDIYVPSAVYQQGTYVYVHISLFLPECACTTIIDISPRIFSLMYFCCVSIIIVICICPPGALIWLLNLFLFLYVPRTVKGLRSNNKLWFDIYVFIGSESE
jgi:hypothetical protein